MLLLLVISMWTIWVMADITMVLDCLLWRRVMDSTSSISLVGLAIGRCLSVVDLSILSIVGCSIDELLMSAIVVIVVVVVCAHVGG